MNIRGNAYYFLLHTAKQLFSLSLTKSCRKILNPYYYTINDKASYNIHQAKAIITYYYTTATMFLLDYYHIKSIEALAKTHVHKQTIHNTPAAYIRRKIAFNQHEHTKNEFIALIAENILIKSFHK